VTYWGVSDAQAAFDRLISPRATQRSTVQDVGGGIRVASVFDLLKTSSASLGTPHFTLSEA